MFEEIIKKIEQYDSIVIFGHLNPDGDCYGSALALKRTLSLKYTDKKFYVTGSGLPEFFDFLAPMDEVSDEIIASSLALLVDANDLPRMEDKRVFNALDWAKIDHHVDTGTFHEGPYVVDDNANSTADLIYLLIKENNLVVDKFIANALYLGLVTDTGHFQFVNDFDQTFQFAAFLVRNGANPKRIDSILNLKKERTLRVKGYVLSNYKKTKTGTIYIIYNKETIKDLKSDTNEISGMINLVGNVINYPVWASFAEYEDGRVRMEIRSNGPIIQPVANRVGGGGHQYAAGATLSSLDMNLIENVIADIDNEIRLWRKNK